MADVLIRGMEMPRRYEILCLFSDGSIGMLDTYSVFNPARPIDCAKAVSLPEGHGRLVDEKWIKKAMTITLESLRKNPKMDNETQAHLIAAFATFSAILDNAPIIVPAEGGGE